MYACTQQLKHVRTLLYESGKSLVLMLAKWLVTYKAEVQRIESRELQLSLVQRVCTVVP